MKREGINEARRERKEKRKKDRKNEIIKKDIRTLNIKEAVLTARSFVFNLKRFLLLT
jgi:polynucleotide 5'-kinase involved in rRNA processing